ncbi:sensor histidine kinase [Rudaea sp.]|uniref:sensor histidine kinase n=1 Tax=Rudaea sp. TaxID=2136325 RepID=UPI00321FD74E
MSMRRRTSNMCVSCASGPLLLALIVVAGSAFGARDAEPESVARSMHANGPAEEETVKACRAAALTACGVAGCGSEGALYGAAVEPAPPRMPDTHRRRWAQAACLVLLPICVVVVRRYRVRRISARLTARMEERLSERERIARDLHDTLLQGLLSASLQLHVANERIDASSPAKPLLERVSQLVGMTIVEVRNAVHGLRAGASAADELDVALARVKDELSIDAEAGLRITATGKAMALHPLIRDEVYRIAREALVNALRHAGAQSIDVRLAYMPEALRVVVCDDGSGIAPELLHEGRKDHWGLPGMQERANAIGGTLRVRSRRGHGTEVELTIPGEVGYVKRAR